jgi:DNA-directed RNA polymerase specialized sigma24 family protein
VLVARAQRGEAAAFHRAGAPALQPGARPRLLAAARPPSRRGRLQEAFTEAYTSLARLDDREAFAAWLRSLVRHHRLRQRDLILDGEADEPPFDELRQGGPSKMSATAAADPVGRDRRLFPRGAGKS